MKTRLIALHGFMMNGALLRVQMGDLSERLAMHAELLWPDAPHVCSPRKSPELPKSPASPDPALRWWAASDDGAVYEGWEASLERVGALIADGPAPIMLGFSQGAIFTAAIAALAAAGRLPPIAGAIMIAGAVPRSAILRPFFQTRIPIPSLHVRGQADRLMGNRPAELAACFGASCLSWPGAHTATVSGEASDAVVRFVSERKPLE